MIEAVFGSAHIQQSVSCFSPESLTMVAGRVAKKVGVGGPGSSAQTFGVGGSPAGIGDGATNDWADRFSRRMEQVEQKIEAAGDRLGERLGEAAKRIRDRVHSRPGAAPAAPLWPSAPGSPPGVRTGAAPRRVRWSRRWRRSSAFSWA
jgi:hypothetical protein